MRRLLISITLAACVALPTAAGAAQGYDRFQSPTGNIRCEYVNQRGVACMTLNNGLGVVLRSYDQAYYLNRRFGFHPRAGWTLGYGRIWRVSSFRCRSERSGMECWSTLTGHGFLINRDGRQIY